jgi:hypothetical protein
MKLNKFNGGLHTSPEPQFIAIEEARQLLNVDVEAGSLASVKSNLASGIATSQHAQYFNAKEQFVDFNTPVDTVEYGNNLYIVDGVGRAQRYDGSNFYNLGIEPPTTKIKATPTYGPEMPLYYEYQVKQVDKGYGIAAAEVYYFVVNKAPEGTSKGIVLRATSEGVTTIATDVLEPPVYSASSEERTFDLKVSIGEFSGFEKVDYLIVYRLFKGKWRQVSITYEDYWIIDQGGDLSNNLEYNPTFSVDITGTIQYAVTFENSASGAESAPGPLSDELDLGIRGAVNVLLENIPVPTDAQVDTVNIYRLGNGYADFVLVAQIPVGAASWFDFGNDDITGELLTTVDNGVPPVGMTFITEAYAMLFGVKGNRLNFTPPGEPNNWPALFFIDFAHDIVAVAPVATGLLVLTKYTTEIVLGTNPYGFSKQTLDNSKGCISAKSLQLVGKSAMWVSTDGICQSSGGPVVVITRPKLGKKSFRVRQSAVHDDIYYLLQEDRTLFVADYRNGLVFHELTPGVEQIVRAADTLYGWVNGELYELFAGDELLEFQYLSPRLFEGQGTRVKQYKNVYILCEGAIIIDVRLDGVSVQIKELSGKGNFTLKIPQDKQKANYSQLYIRGKGKVHEIYWEVTTGDAN